MKKSILSRFNYTSIPLICVVALMSLSCETPNDPSFSTSQKVDAPLLFSKTFTFLGESNALVDTTSSDFDSLFVVDGEGLVSLVVDEKFDFGDLDDAIPEVDVRATNINTEVGVIEFEEFSTGEGAVGSASFEEFTGFQPPPEGTPIPAGQSGNIDIELTTERLVTASVTNGKAIFDLTNDLGFDLSQLTVQFQTEGVDVGDPLIFNNLENGESATDSVDVPPNTVLAIPLFAEVQITWDTQTMQQSNETFIVEEIRGQNLELSEVEGVIGRQTVTKNQTAEIGIDEFEFSSEEDFIEIETGELVFGNITNNIEIGIDSLVISSPELLIPDGDEPPTIEDSLKTTIQIGRNESLGSDIRIDLAGAILQSADNNISYNVFASTENTAEAANGDSVVTVQSTNTFAIDASVNNLVIKRARGIIQPVTVKLNEDDPANGNNILDLFNDTEAEIVDIDGLEDLSDQTEDLTFLNPSLTLNYTTNVGVKNTIFGGLIGIDEAGNQTFLNGIEGSPFQVQPSDTVGGFAANNSILDKDKLIKFDVIPPGTNSNQGSVTFTNENTNIVDFISNVPNEIRFVGKSLVNPDLEVGFLIDPVQFDLTLNLDVPLNIATETNPAVIDDTSDVSDTFGDFPDENDDSQIAEAVINILYTNNLPLNTQLILEFLDTSSGTTESLFTLPSVADDNLTIEAAEVDPVSRFVSTPAEGVVTANITNEQALLLQKAELLRVKGEFLTSSVDGVKIRKDDSITIEISSSLTIETNVSN